MHNVGVRSSMRGESLALKKKILIPFRTENVPFGC